MQRHGFTQRSLSQESGVAEFTILRILRGENTSVDTLVTLAATLHVPVAYLLHPPKAHNVLG
jgi:transcriptional regulator with XRE-family HTH domain